MRDNPVRYVAPPPMTPPPAGWEPHRLLSPSAPRSLPPQDHAELDRAEQEADTVTRTVGIVSLVVVAVVAIVLCGRLLG